MAPCLVTWTTTSRIAGIAKRGNAAAALQPLRRQIMIIIPGSMVIQWDLNGISWDFNEKYQNLGMTS